ncbi:MAG TPA: vWA domain-containing protein [Kofleriaceae bacterium]
MTRVLVLGFALAAVACGGNSFPSLCATQVPPPPGCATPCDPSPSAASSCPTGLHCSGDGKCDTVCTATGGQCGDNYACTSDGRCVANGNGNGGNDTPDACPSAHFQAMKTTPSIELLIDRSGSMLHDFADNRTTDPTKQKFTIEQTALVGAQGVVTLLQGSVFFGASMFPSDKCPGLFKTPDRKANNEADIAALLSAHVPDPNANTPTAQAIAGAADDFMANPAPKGSPPVILLSTDGLPNTCTDSTLSAQARADTVAAAKNAFAKGIRLFLLVEGNQFDAKFAQDLANAGQGIVAGQPAATVYTATDLKSLSDAFNAIIGGVLSCDLQLTGQVDPTAGQNGTVTLNNMTLNYGTDWTLDANGIVIHLLGTACDKLKSSQNPTVDATFACGAVIF